MTCPAAGAMVLLACWPLAAQPPAIGQNGVVNTASRIPPTAAGGALAPGGLFTITGVRLADGVSPPAVTIIQGSIKIQAKVLAMAPERVDARMPSDAPLGRASLTVSRGGQTSSPFPIEIAASNPGLFSRNGRGWGPGRVQTIGLNANVSENTWNSPSHPGGRVRILGTGFKDGQPVDLIIASRAVKASAPRASSNEGEQEIVLTVPFGVAEGCFVPVYALAASKRASNVVTLAIRSGAGPCRPGPLPLFSEKRTVVMLIARSRTLAPGTSQDSIHDEAVAGFAAKDDQPVLSEILLLPPPGACTAYSSSFEEQAAMPSSISSALISRLGGRGLDAGPSLTFRRDNLTRTVAASPDAPGYYRASLGSRERRPNPRSGALFLEPGEFTVAGSGGRDVGPFSLRLTPADAFEWTNREATAVVDRARGVRVEWSGAPPDGRIIILATNVDQITTATGVCLCSALPRANRFAIPPAMLANLPASRDIRGVPYDQLFVAFISEPVTPVAAAGLDAGAAVAIYAIGRAVEYR